MLVVPLPFNTPLLSPGASGPAVASLQQHLLALGYWIDGVTGGYALTTQQAVYAFQKVEGLPRSGIVDIQTSERLKTARRPKPLSTTGYLAEVDKGHQVIKIALNGSTLVINTSTGSGIPYVLDGTTFTAQTPEGHFTVTAQINGLDISPLGTLWRPKFFTGTGIAFHGSPSIPPLSWCCTVACVCERAGDRLDLGQQHHPDRNRGLGLLSNLDGAEVARRLAAAI